MIWCCVVVNIETSSAACATICVALAALLSPQVQGFVTFTVAETTGRRPAYKIKMATDLEFQDIDYDLGERKTPISGIEKDEDGFGSTMDSEKLLPEALPSRTAAYSFWTFEYYQQFFNVNTDQVFTRILSGMIPRPRSNFLESSIRPQPDLYGPVWISLTLIFSIAISGNIVSYMQNIGHTEDIHWSYDFNKVSIASTVILLYVFLVPVGVFTVMWYKGNPANYTLLETVCVYGYSMAIFVPISILWMIPYNFVQWTLVLMGMVLSGSVLALTFWPGLSKLENKMGVIVLAVMLLLHAGIAIGFMLYFFHVPTNTAMARTTPSSMVPSTSAPASHLHLADTEAPPKLEQGVNATRVTAASLLLNKPPPDGRVRPPAPRAATRSPAAVTTDRAASRARQKMNIPDSVPADQNLI